MYAIEIYRGIEFRFEQHDIDKMNNTLLKSAAFMLSITNSTFKGLYIEAKLRDYTGIRETTTVYVSKEYQEKINDYIKDEYNLDVVWDKANMFWIASIFSKHPDYEKYKKIARKEE